MTETTPPVDDAAPVADAPTPDASDDSAPVVDATGGDNGTDDTEVKKLKREAQTQRAARREAEKRLETLEAAEQERKDAELSEVEKLTKDRDAAAAAAATATETARKALIRAEVAAQSVSLKIIDPDAALALMDHTSVTYTDEGAIEGVADALTALVAAKPYLIAGPGTPNLDANNGGRGKETKLTPQQETELLSRRGPTKTIWG